MSIQIAHPLEMRPASRVQFWYKNWKGETSLRKAVLVTVYFGKTKYHTESQWLVKALDLDKQQSRTFAMRDMSQVEHLHILDTP